MESASIAFVHSWFCNKYKILWKTNWAFIIFVYLTKIAFKKILICFTFWGFSFFSIKFAISLVLLIRGFLITWRASTSALLCACSRPEELISADSSTSKFACSNICVNNACGHGRVRCQKYTSLCRASEIQFASAAPRAVSSNQRFGWMSFGLM